MNLRNDLQFVLFHVLEKNVKILKPRAADIKN
jgi:hypothetical protein